MYQIKCDEYILYDPRHDSLKVNNPKCKLEVNTVGEASFTIHANHPFYGNLKKMRSIFEILQDEQTIFRGRMTKDTKDFNNIKAVDLEGVGAFFNDSIVRPFVFPDDFLDNTDYIAAAASGNVVHFFLKWLIDNHNAQVEDFQRFKLGSVTVSDSTNYISRSATDYANTWETLKSKLFDSALGGYLCFRYENDGNYIDYVSDFEYTNLQRITFGKNLLDLKTESASTTSYSAVLPLGMKKKEIDANTDDESRLDISGIVDKDINDDIYKQGDLLISRSAKAAYGLVIAPPKDTTWDDVTLASNLITKGSEYLTATASKLSNTISITAVDLRFTDDEIEAFRIYRYIEFESKPHGHEGRFKLTKLDIDIMNPQNTKITLGDTRLSMTDINKSTKQTLEDRLNSVIKQSGSQGVDLEKISDLNDVKTPNTYVSVNNGAASYTNCPIASGTFVLEVMSAGAEGQVFQRMTTIFKDGKQECWERHFFVGDWGSWSCVYSDTGWIDIPLQSGFSYGSEYGYLKGRLKNDVLHIRGDVKGFTENCQYFALLPDALMPSGLGASNRLAGVYNMTFFCGFNLLNTRKLYVSSNGSGAWDKTKDVSVNITICGN